MSRASDPTASPPHEFSRVVSIARLAADGVVHRITANEAEREALARRFGIVALEHFAAEIRLAREAAGGIRLEAEIEAALVQDCVVTLEPFASSLLDRASIVYRRRSAIDDAALDAAGDDVEPLDGDEIDIGEAAAQQLSLALDPFPRSPAAALPEVLPAGEDKSEDAVPHPFAELAKLVKK